MTGRSGGKNEENLDPAQVTNAGAIEKREVNPIRMVERHMEIKAGQSQVPVIVDKIGHIIEISFGAVSVFIYAAMSAVTLMGVFFRYVMQSPFMWTEEVARYLMLWLGFLGIQLAMRRKVHVSIEVLAGFLPPKILKFKNVLVNLLIAFFLVIILKESWLMTNNTIMMGQVLNISMFWVYISLPIGIFLTLLQLIINMIKDIYSH
jgi:TRAP-type C4-dicarboxylate transport system permease small subunit